MEVAVLGAGLAGSCTALELARRGHDVVLVERDDVPMNRAGLRNEGKVHLGLVYANDRSAATAELQLRGALRFRRLLHSWLGDDVDRIACSAPFTYLVARDSLLDPDSLAAHYQRVERLYHAELAADSTLDYLGTRPDSLFAPSATEVPLARAAFQTAELAVDTEQLARAVRAALDANPRIALETGTTVEHAAERDDVVRVSGTHAGSAWTLDAAQVVNATWESRRALDLSAGLAVPEGWVYRLKYRVIVRLPAALRDAPSLTIVLGRYGDAVTRPDGTAYLSWYPAALRGWSHASAPPASWDGSCRGEPPDDIASAVIEQTLEAMDGWLPGIREAEPLQIDAGVIAAYGATDVDDPDSGLHARTRVGVTSAGRYHSLDPGKLTTAPLFAVEAADRVDAA